MTDGCPTSRFNGPGLALLAPAAERARCADARGSAAAPLDGDDVLIAAFYLGMLLNVGTCWSCIVGSNAAWRITWACALSTAAALPIVLPAHAAYYFGVLANVTLFFRSADTYMGKGSKRWRGIVGGVLLLPGPLVYSDLLSSWKATLLVPTVGHMIVSGVSWPFIVRGLSALARARHGPV